LHGVGAGLLVKVDDPVVCSAGLRGPHAHHELYLSDARVVEALVHGSGYERIASSACSDATIRRRLK
jgi:hypothetical protein